jgi:hypothetical protein
MRVLPLYCAALVLSGLASAQVTVVRGSAGYGYSAPYVPLVTTPQISLQSVSPNPVGASNATWGLVAGATNSTVSQLSGDTSSVYTQPVWYEGGTTPEISAPSVQLPELAPPPAMHMQHMMEMEHMGMMRHEHGRGETAARWTYYASEEEVASPVDAAAAAKSGKHATRTITNQDIDQENQKTGTVKYDGKTETIK